MPGNKPGDESPREGPREVQLPPSRGIARGSRAATANFSSKKTIAIANTYAARRARLASPLDFDFENDYQYQTWNASHALRRVLASGDFAAVEQMLVRLCARDDRRGDLALASRGDRATRHRLSEAARTLTFEQALGMNRRRPGIAASVIASPSCAHALRQVKTVRVKISGPRAPAQTTDPFLLVTPQLPTSSAPCSPALLSGASSRGVTSVLLIQRAFPPLSRGEAARFTLRASRRAG